MQRRAARAKLALGTFASALGLLVLNDALLKGLGVLPGWLTGKLSDVAGLVVAPVCLAVLLSAQRRSTQLCCLWSVAGVFALTELSPACARALERTLAVLGLSWRLWPDPSDLLALAILPVSWLCCRALLAEAGARSPAQRAARWLSLPACLACLASGGTDTFSARAYVYNATERTALVEVSSAWLGCDVLDAFAPVFLEPADLTSLGVFQLPAGAVLPLEPGDLGDEHDARTLGDCMCPVLQVSSAGHTVRVLVRELPHLKLVQQPSAGERKDARGQLVSLLDGPEPFAVGAELVRFELALPGTSAVQVACPAPQPPPLDVSLPPVDFIARDGQQAAATLSDRRLLAVTPIAGSCFELLLAPDGALAPLAGDAGADAAASGPSLSPDTARVQICAPIQLFPFQVGELVQLDWLELGAAETTRETLEMRSSAAGFRLQRGLYFSAPYRSDWRQYVASLPATRCGPLRDAAGEPFEPLDVAYAGQALVPGQAVEIVGASDAPGFGTARQRRIYLGRAERPLNRACGADESWIEVVESWTN